MDPAEDVTTRVPMTEFIDSPPSPLPLPPPPPSARATRYAAATLPPPVPLPLPLPLPSTTGAAGGSLSITSHPSPATVVIVTAGRAHAAGRTPLRTAVDPRLDHDIILAADGYDTIVWRLRPHAPRAVEVSINLRARSK